MSWRGSGWLCGLMLNRLWIFCLNWLLGYDRLVMVGSQVFFWVSVRVSLRCCSCGVGWFSR